MTTLSVHDPVIRNPTVAMRRLESALAHFPEAAGRETAAVDMLEHDVAADLGMDAAVFLPTGKMAQQIALRIHADARSYRRTVLAHPTNHLSLWEDGNVAVLHDLHVRHVGDRHRSLMTSDIERALAANDVGTLLLELPQRELGGTFPSSIDLRRQIELAHAHDVAVHVDGARLWQAPAYYGQPLSGICSGVDSVYVSLYKDVGAPRGAVLAGSGSFIDEARRWRHRIGGTIDEAWPLALLALDGLERVRRRMPDYVAQARAIGAAIEERTPASVTPSPPQGAMLHVHIPVSPDAAKIAQEKLADERQIRVALGFHTTDDPGRCWFEMTIGESAMELDQNDVTDAVERLIDLACTS